MSASNSPRDEGGQLEGGGLNSSMSFFINHLQETIHEKITADLQNQLEDIRSEITSTAKKEVTAVLKSGDILKGFVKKELNDLGVMDGDSVVNRGEGSDDELVDKVCGKLLNSDRFVEEVEGRVGGVKEEVAEMSGRVSELEQRVIDVLLMEVEEEEEVKELKEEIAELKEEVREAKVEVEVEEEVVVVEPEPEPEPELESGMKEPEPEPELEPEPVAEPEHEPEPEPEAEPEPIPEPIVPSTPEPIKPETPITISAPEPSPLPPPTQEQDDDEEKKEEDFKSSATVEIEADAPSADTPSPEPEPVQPQLQPQTQPRTGKVKESIKKKVRKWAASVRRTGRKRAESMFFDAATLQLERHKEQLVEAAKDPSKVSLASLPKMRDVKKKDVHLEKLEKKIDEFFEKTDSRLTKLESWFGKSQIDVVNQKLEVKENKVSVLESIVDRINSVEEKLQVEQVRVCSPLKESVDKIRKALGDNVKKVASLEAGGGLGGKQEIDPAQIQEAMQMKLEKFKIDLQENLEKRAKEQAEENSLSMESFRNEVEVLSGEVSKVSGQNVPTPLDALLAVGLKWLKALEESLKLVEKKQGGIELFAEPSGKALYNNIQKLGAQAGSILRQISSNPPHTIAAGIKKKTVEGMSVVDGLGTMAVALYDFLESVKGSTYELDVIKRLSFKKPPSKVPVKNCKTGLDMAWKALKEFMGSAVFEEGVVVCQILSLQKQCLGLPSAEVLSKTYTPLEYTHNLHDTISVKIAGAHEELKTLETGVKAMISELGSGAEGKELAKKLHNSMDEVRVKFNKMQDEVKNKADSEETYALITTMSDTLRSTLSKTPEISRLSSILKNKADADQVDQLASDLRNVSVSNLPPALTYSTCLTCNRPLGVNVNGQGNGGDGWKRPPSVIDGREMRAINTNTSISNKKKLSDPHSSPVLVNHLVADPRKISAAKNKVMRLNFEEGTTAAAPGVGGTNIISKYPGKLLPTVSSRHNE
ncbi:hypothetical protein TrLO_g15998 [Triparma laevis f. longispina]|uniref:Uncharacterized protein n=1 Tax=Triparma laevis f. longispina TaxID=1714387 RepID=A0A9W7A055_9STRA|nr:hypothetical protein TrLO_g15998 [Triparma laevis f. longispina]